MVKILQTQERTRRERSPARCRVALALTVLCNTQLTCTAGLAARELVWEVTL